LRPADAGMKPLLMSLTCWNVTVGIAELEISHGECDAVDVEWQVGCD
jgi:hypothetical protein